MANFQTTQSTYSPAKPNSTMAIASLVLSILGWTALPGIGAIAGVITGHMAKREISESMGALGGEGLANAGLIIGYVNLGLGLCACLVFATLLAVGISIPFINQ
jgi:hypothetical protein